MVGNDVERKTKKEEPTEILVTAAGDQRASKVEVKSRWRVFIRTFTATNSALFSIDLSKHRHERREQSTAWRNR
jgi:hypothetical protein